MELSSVAQFMKSGQVFVLQLCPAIDFSTPSLQSSLSFSISSKVIRCLPSVFLLRFSPAMFRTSSNPFSHRLFGLPLDLFPSGL